MRQVNRKYSESVNWYSGAWKIWINAFRNYVLLYGLGGFAYATVLAFLMLALSGELSWSVIYRISLLTLIFLVLNFALSKLFPKRFVAWGRDKIKSGIDLIDFLFSPPFSVFAMSIALSCFVVSLLDQTAILLWQEALHFMEKGFEQLALFGSFIFLPILFLIVCWPLIFIIKFSAKIKRAGIFIKILLVFGYLGYWGILLSAYYIFNNNINEFVFNLSITIIKFIIGFIPLGWLYELFVCSIIKQENA